MELRFKEHKYHADLIREFYSLNKYYLTEQMKDALIDAYECLEYVHKADTYNRYNWFEHE
jgi:hypothetical protein